MIIKPLFPELSQKVRYIRRFVAFWRYNMAFLTQNVAAGHWNSSHIVLAIPNFML